MILTNKIYITYFKNGINERSSSFVDYTLNDAIESGKYLCRELFYEKYDRDPEDDSEFEQFMESEITDASFLISEISGNRIQFETSDEIINYFFDHIDNIDNENLYEFLLSLVESNDMYFNYKGELISSTISTQFPSKENTCMPYIEFTEASCKEGKYKFSYDLKGRDTLYHASWIKEK